MDDTPSSLLRTIEISHEPSSSPLVVQARLVGDAAAADSDSIDQDGAFPVAAIALLHRAGLLHAPFPASRGGDGLGIGDPNRLRAVLVTLGRGNLALGRLYEGHVNAVSLVTRYGTPANLKLLEREADAGRPSGVWMAGDALRLEASAAAATHVLKGNKILCSGAGYVRRPLVAADHAGASVMVIPEVADDRADISGWTAHGMRATATGHVDFNDVVVGVDEIVGRPGDYLRSPYFRGGAWRVIAVQLGGLQAVFHLYKTQLAESPYCDHPIQLARFGEAAIAMETARLWVRQASLEAEGPAVDCDAVDAYVDLARNAFEMAALRLIALTQKAIGLKAFMRPNPMERIIRDLTTYMRQPALDLSLSSAAAFHLDRQEDALEGR